MTSVWPAFLMAGVLEVLVFAVVDPGALHWFGAQAVELSAPAVYTLAFFVFWVVIATSAALTQMLDMGTDEGDLPRDRRSNPWPR
jgi:NO-binding membrane sensor protein with MHYT domain